MEGAVEELHLDVFDRIARQNAVAHGLDYPLLHRPDVFFRDDAAHDGVLEFESFPLFVRLQLDPDVAVLAPAAGLADELPFGLDLLPDRFLVRHLRLADVGFDLKFPLHPVDDDFEVQLAHAADDVLPGLLVRVDAERGIFLGELGERFRHFLLIGLGLRFDGDMDNGIRESHLLQDNRVILIAQRVAGASPLQAHCGDDIAGKRFVNIFARVRMHAQHAADPLLFVRDRIVHVRTGLQGSGIDTEVRELPDIRVRHDLERQRGEFLTVRHLALNLVGHILVMPNNFSFVHIEGRREVAHHSVEQHLHALILEGRAAQNRDDAHLQARPAKDRHDFLRRNLLAFQVLLE